MYARCVSNSPTTGTETSTTNDHDRISRKLCWQQLHSVCSNCSVRHRICKYAERRQIESILSNWPSTSLRRRCIKVGLSESHIMRSMSHFRSIDKFQHDTSGKRAREGTSSREDFLRPNIDCVVTLYTLSQSHPILDYQCFTTCERVCLFKICLDVLKIKDYLQMA